MYAQISVDPLSIQAETEIDEVQIRQLLALCTKQIIGKTQISLLTWNASTKSGVIKFFDEKVLGCIVVSDCNLSLKIDKTSHVLLGLGSPRE